MIKYYTSLIMRNVNLWTIVQQIILPINNFLVNDVAQQILDFVFHKLRNVSYLNE